MKCTLVSCLVLQTMALSCSSRKTQFKLNTDSVPQIDSEKSSQAKKRTPLVIGHRGASGILPEHTLESYQLAIDQGADFIEPDLVATKDGFLIARHENRIDETSNVAEKFPDKKKTKTIDGKTITGWFTEDLTLAEVKSLRARERLPFREQTNNDKFEIVTFDEVLSLAKEQSDRLKRTIGIYPELKHSTYFRSIGLPLEKKFIESLKQFKWNHEMAPVIVQSFEVGNLVSLSKESKVRLMQLVRDEGPPDLYPKDPSATYASMMTPDGLKKVKAYASILGLPKIALERPAADGKSFEPTGLVDLAHSLGFQIHVWTFRNEDSFLHPLDQGNPEQEICRFVKMGVNGLFSDFPGTAKQAIANCK